MPAASAEVTLTEGTNLSVDVSPVDGRVAFDLLGRIWTVPPNGGEATPVTERYTNCSRPRWSPDGRSILCLSSSAGRNVLKIHDLDTDETRTLGAGLLSVLDADWHPEARRIVFAAAESDGTDLRELHLPTGLTWRLTHTAGNERYPTWSPDGRDLAWVREQGGTWQLMIRMQGRPDRRVVVSETPLAAPAWRPDGSLLTFLRQEGDRYVMELAILSDPPVQRSLATGEDFFLDPASWADRQRLVYASNGSIKSRHLNEWRARSIPFRATIADPAAPPDRRDDRELDVVDPGRDALVIRAARLFDGETAGYRHDIDVRVEDGRIVEVAPSREVSGATLVELGDAAVLPGYIDLYASLPPTDGSQLGPELLAYGITTLVAANNAAGIDAASWESEASPGPRLLRARTLDGPPAEGALPALVALPDNGPPPADSIRPWQSAGVPVLARNLGVALATGADLLLGVDTLPTSPLGRRYLDLHLVAASGPLTLVSGLADAATPGIEELGDSRQARRTGRPVSVVPRRLAWHYPGGGATTVAIGSLPNGLPPGMALHAELLALAAAGLSGEQALRAAGANAAAALGLPNELGRIVPGAVADLVFVTGDPLARVEDALQIVAVVRNGRFFSQSRLLDSAATTVE